MVRLSLSGTVICTNVRFAIVIINDMITVGTHTLHCCTKWSSPCEWSLANLALLCVCNCLTHRVILQRLYLVHSTQLVINYWLAHLIILLVCGTQEQAGKREKKTFAYESSLSPLGLDRDTNMFTLMSHENTVYPLNKEKKSISSSGSGIYIIPFIPSYSWPVISLMKANDPRIC